MTQSALASGARLRGRGGDRRRRRLRSARPRGAARAAGRGRRARLDRPGRPARLPARRRRAPACPRDRGGVAVARSPYEVLGVPKTATDDEIKKAYRKLARESHPDANQGDAAAEERFKEIQGAYDTLSDAEKRKQYDTFGANGARGGRWPRPGRVRLRERRPLRPARPVRRHLRPRRRRRARPQPERGADLESRVRLSFEDALAGAQVRVPVEVDAAVPHLPRNGRRARHVPDHLPAVRRLRHGLRLARPLRALAAVPALPRQRRHRREAVHDVPRHRARAGDEALCRQDPGRREGRHAGATEGQG